jgi:predicted transcriptional regulator
MNASIDYEDKNVLGWGNRGWLDIVDFILEVCENGSLKTHITYKCNLNSKQVERYIQFLLDCKLVETIQSSSNRTIYKTTEPGKKYIGRYKDLAGLFN